MLNSRSVACVTLRSPRVDVARTSGDVRSFPEEGEVLDAEAVRESLVRERRHLKENAEQLRRLERVDRAARVLVRVAVGWPLHFGPEEFVCPCRTLLITCFLAPNPAVRPRTVSPTDALRSLFLGRASSLRE